MSTYFPFYNSSTQTAMQRNSKGDFENDVIEQYTRPDVLSNFKKNNLRGGILE